MSSPTESAGTSVVRTTSIYPFPRRSPDCALVRTARRQLLSNLSESQARGGFQALTVLEEYLRSLYYDRSSGEAVRETSYYGALQNLFNAAGDDLRPKVRAILNIRNRGAGIPDGGLFTQQQYERGLGEATMGSGQLPERGAVEVKGVEEEVADVARDEQVGRYLERYGQVLV